MQIDEKLEQIIKELESLSSQEDREGMARFGINTEKVFAVRMPELSRIAKQAGKNHELALKLWDADYNETKILASMIDDPKLVTEEQMEKWAIGFNSWDVCDQACMKLFRKTPFAYEKVFEWSKRKEEFVKRAAFTLIATLAVHDKKEPDEKIEQFFPIIVSESTDERIYVKKAVNWALRQIGKRNLKLNKKAIDLAEEIDKINSRSAKWIAKDALRELKSDKIQRRLLVKS